MSNTRRFLKLKARMVECGISQAQLSKSLKLCPMSVSRRFTGKLQWRLNEIYLVMNILNIPRGCLETYFPPAAEAVASMQTAAGESGRSGKEQLD